MVTDARERGQLILIGAVTVALLVIGVAIVVNTVLFTENVRPSEADAQLQNAEDVNHELRRSAQALTLRVNHATRNHSSPDLAHWVRGNVTRMSHLYEESYLASGPTAVNVSYNVSASRNGSRLVQASDGAYVDAGGGENWQPVDPDGGDQRLGWAVFNLNVSESTMDPFQATFTNESGETVTMTFTKTTGPEAFNVATTTSTGGSASVECTPRNQRVLLNVQQGESYTDDSCVFNGSAELGNVTTVNFEDGDHVVGKYAMVAKKDTLGGAGPCQSGPPLDEPCSAPAVWDAYVTVSIIGDGFDLEKSHNVSVYPGGA